MGAPRSRRRYLIMAGALTFWVLWMGTGVLIGALIGGSVLGALVGGLVAAILWTFLFAVMRLALGARMSTRRPPG